MYDIITWFDETSWTWGGLFSHLVGLDFEQSDDAHIFLGWWEEEGRKSFKDYHYLAMSGKEQN